MGAWGVKTTESDYGLDLLDDPIEAHWQKTGFKYFKVRDIMELLKQFVLEEWLAHIKVLCDTMKALLLRGGADT